MTIAMCNVKCVACSVVLNLQKMIMQFAIPLSPTECFSVFYLVVLVFWLQLYCFDSVSQLSSSSLFREKALMIRLPAQLQMTERESYQTTVGELFPVYPECVKKYDNRFARSALQESFFMLLWSSTPKLA